MKNCMDYGTCMDHGNSPENGGSSWFLPMVRSAGLLLLFAGILASCSDSFDFYDELGENSVPGMSLMPGSAMLQVGESGEFEASGGVPEYVFTLDAGAGTLQPIDGYRVRYTAPDSPGSAVLLVTDRDGRTARSAVTVLEALSISPEELVTIVGRTHDFSATGGLPPYEFSASAGTIEPGDGIFVAPGTAGKVTITVRDNARGEDHAFVTVYSELRILPDSRTIRSRESIDFDGEGGDGSYTFSLVSGGGRLDEASGRYTAPLALFQDLTVIVQVADGLGQTASATIRVESIF